eukprot:scaffold281282_cov36-Tisochrysis_lutea.AAC.4
MAASEKVAHDRVVHPRLCRQGVHRLERHHDINYQLCGQGECTANLQPIDWRSQCTLTRERGPQLMRSADTRDRRALHRRCAPFGRGASHQVRLVLIEGLALGRPYEWACSHAK